jgi:2-polyprenyl-3-methyl-5-hydroxy-6-metoxy-1,4-benzoquinol methylase/peptidoglycan/xylan/chitin deacetylase (PgdA/CDA1 family)
MKRVLLLADRPGWAFDTVARALAQRLAPAIEAQVAYSAQRPELDPCRYDLVHVFFWGERWHQRRFSDPRQVMKELSSHRFEYQTEYGLHTPREAVDRFMRDSGTLVATSQRLFDLFSPVHERVRQYRLGTDTDLFRPAPALREGPIRVCWVGNRQDPLKGVDDLLLPASNRAGVEISIAPGDLPQNRMADFYRGFDVLAISSVAEGTPLPLLEAMACGLWVVTTDVGSARELVRDGEGGRMVSRNPEAFANALLEATSDPQRTRELGRANADRIRLDRTWDQSAATFREIVEEALAFRADAVRLPEIRIDDDHRDYDKHLERINPGGFSEGTYQASRIRLEEDLRALLPALDSARILEIGSGFGHTLRWLSELGYTRLTAVDLSAPLLQGVREYIGERLEHLEVADAKEFLGRCENDFDFIILFDVLEHMPLHEARQVLRSAIRALAPDGIIVLRTPNMANALGSYSRYLDTTHQTGYTEQSLLHLLAQAGVTKAGLHIPRATSYRRRFAWRLNQAAHSLLFKIQDRSMPRWFGKNIVVWGIKTGSSPDISPLVQSLTTLLASKKEIDSAKQDRPFFRNDDVSWDTSLEHFRRFCAVFHKYGQLQIHGITLRGCTNTAHIHNGSGVEYEGHESIATLDNATIRRLSDSMAIESRADLIGYLNASQDEVALHGLYHTDYSTMSEEEQDRDIAEGLAITRRLFPGKHIRFFIAPFNRTNAATCAVAARYDLTILAADGVLLEEELDRLKVRPGQWYRYHHHRFYPESLFTYYDLSIEKLDMALAKNFGRNRQRLRLMGHPILGSLRTAASLHSRFHPWHFHPLKSIARALRNR